jgi:hypothetical protein
MRSAFEAQSQIALGGSKVDTGGEFRCGFGADKEFVINNMYCQYNLTVGPSFGHDPSPGLLSI